MSSWEVNIGLDRRSVILHLTSVFPATFSAQLCVPDERGCTPLGEIHSVTMVCTQTRFSERLFIVWVSKCVTLLIHPPENECLGYKDKCARSFSRSKTLCAGRRDSQRCQKDVFFFISFCYLTLFICLFGGVAVRSSSSRSKNSVPGLWVHSECIHEYHHLLVVFVHESM